MPEKLGRVHRLRSTAESVSVGIIDPTAKPVLSVQPGDVVELDTWGHWGNLVKPDMSIAEVRELKQHFPGALGPHSITGPIEVQGAELGDALVVDVLELLVDDHGFNLTVAQPHGRGVLKDRFPEGGIRHFVLDAQRCETFLGDGIRIPLNPFLGIMGVAPAGTDSIGSVEPGIFGGNIDLSEMVVGSTLVLPVLHPGAGFYCGDAHAAQGDGEVNQTAIETSMKLVRLRFGLLKGAHLRTPRAWTDRHRITLGFGPSLELAAREAVDDMVDWLVEQGMDDDDAYCLVSVQGSLRVTQMVNGVVGMHVLLSHIHGGTTQAGVTCPKERNHSDTYGGPHEFASRNL